MLCVIRAELGPFPFISFFSSSMLRLVDTFKKSATSSYVFHILQQYLVLKLASLNENLEKKNYKEQAHSHANDRAICLNCPKVDASCSQLVRTDTLHLSIHHLSRY